METDRTCPLCGKSYTCTDAGDEFDLILRQICPDCITAISERNSKRMERESEQIFLRKLPDLFADMGIERNYAFDRTTGKMFTEPPVRFVAEWLYRKRSFNVLLSGETGSGKTTSACFIAARMIQTDSKKVLYTTLRKLLTDWRKAKQSDKPGSEESILYRLFTQELLIIDEVVGKAKITESGSELLWEILDGVSSGACRSTVWLLGNFYGGSLETLFTDPEPARRRLQENFACVYIDKQNQTVNPITVWEEVQS